MFKLEGEVRSAYGEVGGRLKEDGGRDRCYVDRPEGVQSASGWKIKEDEKVVEERKKGEWGDRVRRGDFEPKYTNCLSLAGFFWPLLGVSLTFVPLSCSYSFVEMYTRVCFFLPFHPIGRRFI